MCLLKLVVGLITGIALATSATGQPSIFRVNSGGNSYIDTQGKHWSADQVYSSGSWGYVAGQTYQTEDPISGTSDDPLYQTERFWLDAYRFDVPNGDYQITLKFAEIWYQHINNRIFHVKIEGQTVLSYFDIYATIGHDYALDYTYTFNVNDGTLDIDFEHYEPYAHAKISAIEVVPIGIPIPQLSVNPTSINFGSIDTIRTFEITNSGSGLLNWRANVDPEKSWITSISPDSGTLNASQSQTVTVAVNRDGLTGGNYDGTIAVTSNAGNQNVAVSMQVVSTEPVLSVEPDTLDYGGLLTRRSFELQNIGGGNLDWIAVTENDEAWLVFDSPTNGSLLSGERESLAVAIDRTRLNEGTYFGTITVISNGGNEAVTLKIRVGRDTLRVNCGGSSYTDTHGMIWLADMGFDGGDLYSVTHLISNTDDPVLYQTERWGMEAYQFHLQNNKIYDVTLHFAEVYWGSTGKRIFDVSLEDSLVLDDFDIFAWIGANVADQKKVRVTVTDGQLDLAFAASVDAAKLSALEIAEAIPGPFLSVQPNKLDFGDTLSTLSFTITNTGVDTLKWHAIENPEKEWIITIQPDSGYLLAGESDTVMVSIERKNLPDRLNSGTVFISSNGGVYELAVSARADGHGPYSQRVNTGGEAYTSVGGDFFDADQPYQAGSWGYLNGQIYFNDRNIKNTEDDFLYKSERWGLDSYIFDVPDGYYMVKLHFSEIYFRNPGKRIMEVVMEGKPLLTDWDIWAEVGERTAIIKTYTVLVNDSQLNIDFSASLDDPKVSAIEVVNTSVTADLAKRSTWEAKPTDPEKTVPIKLSPNYPNPFNLETKISYQLPATSQVTLDVFNALGQKQATLVDAEQAAGYYTVAWKAKNMNELPVATGIYFFRLIAKPIDSGSPPFMITRRMLLTK